MKKLFLLIYYGIATWFPTQPMPGWRLGYSLRRFLVRHIAESCGRDVIIKHKAYIGSGVGLRIGSRAQLGHNARIGNDVSIGEDVVMGPDVVVMTSAHAFDDLDTPINKQGALPIRPVKIGRDVWIGTRVIIMPGVMIGDGAVIGAGSVVSKNIPPRAVAAGVPARVIRMRGAGGDRTDKSRVECE